AQPKVDVRVFAGEGPQHGCQPGARQGADDGHVHRSRRLVSQRTDRRPGVFQRRQRSFRIRQQHATGLAEADGARAAVEQRGVELGFQQGDAAADGRLRAVQPLGRAGEAAGAVNGQKGDEGLGVHGAILCILLIDVSRTRNWTHEGRAASLSSKTRRTDMEMREQAARTAVFRALHERGFILPNAWDVGSAVVLAEAGFPAVATTSAGIAFSLGRPDYQVADHRLALSREETLARAGEIAAALAVPVSADLEAGYGDAPEAVAETVRLAASAGLVGGNIEDARPGGGL